MEILLIKKANFLALCLTNSIVFKNIETYVYKNSIKAPHIYNMCLPIAVSFY